MLMFNLGFALIYTAACIVALVAERMSGSPGAWVTPLAMSALAVPVAAGWAGAELVRLVRSSRLRVFNTAHSWWLARLVRGMLCGVVSVAGALAIFCFFDARPPDAAVTGIAAALASAGSLVIGRRVPVWACLGCGYDLRGLTGSAGGRCPECGAAAAAPVRIIRDAGPSIAFSNA